MYNKGMDKTAQLRAFTCNLPLPFFKKIKKIAEREKKPIRDVIVALAEKGMRDVGD